MSILNKTYKFLSLLLNNNVQYTTTPRTIFTKNLFDGTKRKLHVTYNLPGLISWKMSDIGEGIQEVVVKQWFVKEGDKVKEFDNICEVQSDKAVVTITSRYNGVIKKLYYKLEETARIGQPFVDIEVEGAVDTPATASPPQTTAPSDSKKDVPKAPSQPSGLLPSVRRLATENLVDLSKVLPTGHRGHILKEDVISYLATRKSILCIPAVRKFAKDNKVNLEEVVGTGKDGRILKEDVLKYIESRHAPGRDQVGISPVGAIQADKTQPLTPFQKGMAKTMTEALKIPHFLYCEEVNVTKLIDVKNSIKKVSQKSGVKITVMPFFIKAVSNALHRHPLLNATVDERCENITLRGAHNIGIAMDTKMGLAVPVIKNVNRLTIVDIAQELNRLMKSGKAGTFTPNDLKGGTFTLSNIGIIGGTYGKPVILPPAVAILAVGSTKTLPRFDESKKVVAHDIMCVNGAGDHRVIDGATMANFVNHFKQQLENPNLLMLNL